MDFSQVTNSSPSYIWFTKLYTWLTQKLLSWLGQTGSGFCPLHRSPHCAAEQDTRGLCWIEREIAKFRGLLGVKMVILAYFSHPKMVKNWETKNASGELGKVCHLAAPSELQERGHRAPTSAPPATMFAIASALCDMAVDSRGLVATDLDK